MMPEDLRTGSGPWCGALTDTSATIRAAVFKTVKTARVLVSQDPALSNSVRSFEIADTDYWTDRFYQYKVATARITGLEASTLYHYALELDGNVESSLPGRFRTAPRLGSASGFRFALSGCAKSSGMGGKRCPEPYQAIAGMQDVLFFFHLGDFHYEDISGGKNNDDNEDEEQDLSLRLDAYDGTLRSEAVGDLFRTVPIAYGWDDHDFLGNNSCGADPRYLKARQRAREAYDNFVPHYPLADQTDGIYQSFQIGRVLFLLTDNRFNKSPKNVAGTSRTVLGAKQKAWLKGQLIRGKELDLIVWASSFAWIGKADKGEDFWAGYEAERAELAQFIFDSNVRNLCMISADAHMLAIDSGEHSGYAKDEANPEQPRGGFPVFHAAALESMGTTKGGPTYSLGELKLDKKTGAFEVKSGGGLGERRQFGLCEIVYDGATPRVIWTGLRATKAPVVAKPLLEYRFAAKKTYDGF
jgi:phosphodiesterase/alkaline phosphatase D-like protein